MRGATILASLWIMNLGESGVNLFHVIFSLGTAPLYPPVACLCVADLCEISPSSRIGLIAILDEQGYNANGKVPSDSSTDLKETNAAVLAEFPIPVG